MQPESPTAAFLNKKVGLPTPRHFRKFKDSLQGVNEAEPSRGRVDLSANLQNRGLRPS
jgi:hypothetical protein